MPSLHLPEGDFYHLARFDDSTDDEPLDGCARYCPFLVGGSDDALCVGFFSRKGLAEVHRRYLPENDWRITRVPREALLEWLECIHGAGINRAVMDPPLGFRGAGEPISSILMESE
jgi:hypothetical protein